MSESSLLRRVAATDAFPAARPLPEEITADAVLADVERRIGRPAPALPQPPANRRRALVGAAGLALVIAALVLAIVLIGPLTDTPRKPATGDQPPTTAVTTTTTVRDSISDIPAAFPAPTRPDHLWVLTATTPESQASLNGPLVRIESPTSVAVADLDSDASGQRSSLAVGHGSLWLTEWLPDRTIGRGTSRLRRLDPVTLEEVSSVDLEEVPFSEIHQPGFLFGLPVVTTPDSVWVASRQTASLYQIDPQSGAVRAIALEGAPVAITATPAEEIWVVGTDPIFLAAISAEGTVRVSESLADEPAVITASADGRVFVGYRTAGLAEIDSDSGAELARWDVGGRIPVSHSIACCVEARIAVPVANGFVALLDPGDGSIERIDLPGVAGTALGPDGQLYGLGTNRMFSISAGEVAELDPGFPLPPPFAAVYGTP